MKRLIGGLLAAATLLIAAPVSAAVAQTATAAHPAASNDLDLVSVRFTQNPGTNTELLDASIYVKVNDTPQSFHMIADLQVWSNIDHQWTTADTEVYHLHQLPAAGTSGYLHPRLETACFSGKWRIRMDVRTRSSQGFYFHYPKLLLPHGRRHFKRIRCSA